MLRGAGGSAPIDIAAGAFGRPLCFAAGLRAFKRRGVDPESDPAFRIQVQTRKSDPRVQSFQQCGAGGAQALDQVAV